MSFFQGCKDKNFCKIPMYIDIFILKDVELG